MTKAEEEAIFRLTVPDGIQSVTAGEAWQQGHEASLLRASAVRTQRTGSGARLWELKTIANVLHSLAGRLNPSKPNTTMYTTVTIRWRCGTQLKNVQVSGDSCCSTWKAEVKVSLSYIMNSNFNIWKINWCSSLCFENLCDYFNRGQKKLKTKSRIATKIKIPNEGSNRVKLH